jgi:antitoxin component of MazEF toxin-antitoxin module
MPVKVCKHGNSLSIRLSAHITRLTQMKAGDYVSVRLLDSGDILVRPTKLGSVALVQEAVQAPVPISEQW